MALLAIGGWANYINVYWKCSRNLHLTAKKWVVLKWHKTTLRDVEIVPSVWHTFTSSRKYGSPIWFHCCQLIFSLDFTYIFLFVSTIL